MTSVPVKSSATAADPWHRSQQPQTRVYVWDLVVRLCHWAIALTILLLSVTGIYIGSPYMVVPGEAGAHFVTGTMRVIHFYAAIVFALAVLTRLLWMFVGPERSGWREFLPVERQRLLGLIETLKFYLFARAAPPRSPGHNPLAGLTYVAVFGLHLLMILTGLGLYGAAAHAESWMRLFAPLGSLCGSLQSNRYWHHLAMWLLIGFSAHHFLSALLISLVKKNGTLDSIFSGFKWVHPQELEREQRRFERRQK